MTNFEGNYPSTISLASNTSFTLGAAVKGENDEIYYIMIEDGEP